MKKFRTWNVLLAWFSFVVAIFTYLSTIEPTVSFWDCGEFMAAADKLMIVHPPGAPLFLMIARVFALFAPSPDKVAMMINAMSALCSAFTILFLFWTISMMSRKLIVGTGDMTRSQGVAILASALVGSLSYAFTDSFWFSAVEGEVYAMSSLFTAVVFWAILRWDNEAHQPQALRWLVLIALLMGLSIGVHLLNLLVIPAIALVYYYRMVTSPTIKGVVVTLMSSALSLAFVMYGVIPGSVKISAVFDLLFVNVFGLPYNSGLVVFYLLLLGGLSCLIYRSHRRGKVLLNTVACFFLVLFIGYSSYAMIVVRSLSSPAMNQNAPDDAYSLLSYLNREQYGDNPLLYGQFYNTPVLSHETNGEIRDQIDGRYEVVGEKYRRVYDDAMMTLFPRMWSDNPSHVAEYKRWANIKGKKVKASGGEVLQKPTMRENLRYFFKYQVGHMYWRYFMWNFVGRQNDVPGHGGRFNGNWLSGLSFVDDFFIGGDSSKLPDRFKNNKARNAYYFLPLLLGLAGIVFQLRQKGKTGYQSFVIVSVFFVLTGLAIVVYLNQYPLQPRERDYSFAASFYAFSIWIGMGVLCLWEVLSRVVSSHKAIVVSAFCGLMVPALLAYENWDDHDRSNRYVARDTAYNYLMSCEPNAILFTFADNDTFPLWYLQEVEGVRTDVRICNLTYMNTDWYIEHMRSDTEGASSVKFSLDHEQTRMAQNSHVYLLDYTNKSVGLNAALAWLKSDNPKTKMVQGKSLSHLPSKLLHLPVEKVKAVDCIPSLIDTSLIVDDLVFDYGQRQALQKNNIMVLDLIASNQWERPIYYANSVSPKLFFGLETYFQMCGVVSQVVPVASKGRINTSLMYDNVMLKYCYGNIKDSRVYLDNDSRKQAMQMRRSFVSLANMLHQEGDVKRACEVMKKCLVEIPSSSIPFDYRLPYQNDFIVVDTLLKLEMKNDAVNVISEMRQTIKQDMEYYLSFDFECQPELLEKLRQTLTAYYQINTFYQKCMPDEALDVEREFSNYYSLLEPLLKG